MLLTIAPVGLQMVVLNVTGKDEMRQHLANLGFVEGAFVKVVTALHGNVIINVKETRVALDTSLSNRIIVDHVESVRDKLCEH